MFETWKPQTWGDLATLEYGKGLREYNSTEPVYPVFGTNGQIGWHSSPLWGKAGIVIGRKGAYRGVHYSSKPFFVIDTAFYLKPKTGFDLKWAYYQLKDFDINKIDSGSAIPSTSREAFYAIPVTLPPLATQRKIAAVLSTYDDLVENNTRRIQILEEMAQALYREWFVNFRFPGHETSGMVESEVGPIPEGWRVTPFSQAANFVNGFAFAPHHWKEDGLPIIKIAELKNGVTDKTPRNPGDDVPAKFHIINGDVLFSWSADLDAYIWGHGVGLLNQHLFKVEPTDGITKVFLYFSLKDRMGEFRNRSNGATMKHIKRSALDEVCFAAPAPELVRRFSDNVNPIVEQTLNLASRNNCLRQTRDLLLPKLISGEVDVADLDIAMGETN